MIVVYVVILLIGVFLFLLWQGQERILFQPPRADTSGEHATRVDYRASDGQPLAGYMVGDPHAASGVLLSFHGNADIAIWLMDWARLVSMHTGYAVFLAEYRGYMSLGGKPTYDTTKLDSLAAYDYLQAVQQTPTSHIAFFGHSLGSAVAAELAAIRRPHAVLLQAPFTSARAMGRLMVSPPVELVWKLISRIHFDTLDVVRRLDTPVAVCHGRLDRVIPVRMGLEIYDAAARKGPLLVLDNGGHNDLPEIGGDAYWQWIRSALTAPGGIPNL